MNIEREINTIFNPFQTELTHELRPLLSTKVNADFPRPKNPKAIAKKVGQDLSITE
jgi:hypothetical protein